MAKLKLPPALRKLRIFSQFAVLGTALADIVAPARCMGCLCEGTWLCPTCSRHLGHYPLSCIVCKKPHPRGLTCVTCRATTPLTGTVAVGPYHSVLLQRGIGWLKFKGVRAVAPVLAQLLTPRLLTVAPVSQLQQEAVLIPIPLHRRRLRERGFNQSLELARHLSQRTGIPLATPLKRVRSTWTQSHLPPELRHHNVAAAFSLRKALPNTYKTILLIDDVTTTGSTLGAAAAVLQSTSPATVWGVTIARG